MLLSWHLSRLLERHKRLCAVDDSSIDAVLEVKRQGGLNVGLAGVDRSWQNQVETCEPRHPHARQQHQHS